MTAPAVIASRMWQVRHWDTTDDVPSTSKGSYQVGSLRIPEEGLCDLSCKPLAEAVNPGFQSGCIGLQLGQHCLEGLLVGGVQHTVCPQGGPSLTPCLSNSQPQASKKTPSE